MPDTAAIDFKPLSRVEMAARVASAWRRALARSSQRSG